MKPSKLLVKRLSSWGGSSVGFILVLLLWIIAYDKELISHLVIPSPSQVLIALLAWAGKTMWIDLGYTFERLSVSVAFGSIIGLLLGTVISRAPWLLVIMSPIIAAFRSIPAIALYPLFAFAFGIGELPKYSAITFGVLFLVMLYTIQGITTVSRTLLLIPRTIVGEDIKARRWIIFQVLLPGALPTILFGFRLAIPIALIMTVATEMFFGTTYGLGSRIISSQLAYRLPEAWAAIIVTGLLGLLLNLFFNRVETKYSFWVSK